MIDDSFDKSFNRVASINWSDLFVMTGEGYIILRNLNPDPIRCIQETQNYTYNFYRGV